MTYLIQAPPYVFAYIATVAISWSSGRFGEHCWHIIGSTIGCIVGVVIMISTLNPGARYFGMFLMCSGPFVGLNVCLGHPEVQLKSIKLISNRSIFLGKPPTLRDPVPSVARWSPLPIVSHRCLIGSHHTYS